MRAFTAINGFKRDVQKAAELPLLGTNKAYTARVFEGLGVILALSIFSFMLKIDSVRAMIAAPAWNCKMLPSPGLHRGFFIA